MKPLIYNSVLISASKGFLYLCQTPAIVLHLAGREHIRRDLRCRAAVCDDFAQVIAQFIETVVIDAPDSAAPVIPYFLVLTVITLDHPE